MPKAPPRIMRCSLLLAIKPDDISRVAIRQPWITASGGTVCQAFFRTDTVARRLASGGRFEPCILRTVLCMFQKSIGEAAGWSHPPILVFGSCWEWKQPAIGNGNGRMWPEP